MPDVNLNVKTRGTKKAETSFQKLGKSIANMATSYIGGAAAVTGLVMALKSTTDAAAKQEQIFRKMQTSIMLTGTSFRSVKDDLFGYFELLQRTTEYGDTDSAQVFTTLIQLLGDYDKAVRALPVALDLAATGLFDVNTAARNVAMTFSGNIEPLARYISELKASVNPFLATASAAEKAAFAINLLNENFGGTAAENVKTYAGQMKQLANRMEDLQEKTGNLFIKLISDTGLLGIFEKVAREMEKSWLNLSGPILLYNMLIGETEQGIKDLGAAVKPVVENLDSEFDDQITDAINNAKYAVVDFVKLLNLSMHELQIEGMEKDDGIITRMFLGDRKDDPIKPIMGAFRKVQGVAEPVFKEMLDDSVMIVAHWDKVGMQMVNTFDYVFTETLIRQQNFGDAMVAGLESMLSRMAASIMARAGVLGLFSIFGGGGLLTGAGTALDFITGGLFSHDGAGLSPGGGGTTVNINMPNVATINSKSIRQLRQALSRHDRLH